LSDKRRQPRPHVPDIVIGRFTRNLHLRFSSGLRMNPILAETGYDRASTRKPVDESKLRVVIVEDSAIIRARLAETLSEIRNLTIVGQADTESEALQLLSGGGWDAVILDLQLKQGTGLGVLKKLRDEGRPTHSKVIVFTNYAFPQYRDRSLSSGADYFFDKAREFHRVRDVLADLASGDLPH
jgi:CheY-like chemotaxis protein